MCTIRVHLVLINHDAKAIASLSCYFYRILIIILEIDFLNKNFSTRLIVKTVSHQILFISIEIQFIWHYILHYILHWKLSRTQKENIRTKMLSWLYGSPVIILRSVKLINSWCLASLSSKQMFEEIQYSMQSFSVRVFVFFVVEKIICE